MASAGHADAAAKTRDGVVASRAPRAFPAASGEARANATAARLQSSDGCGRTSRFEFDPSDIARVDRDFACGAFRRHRPNRFRPRAKRRATTAPIALRERGAATNACTSCGANVERPRW
ncbi:hypothetical protein ABU614_05495 [Lysobacter firmicutimachus]|uniref:Uncharacterized protein n=1 Tax=Lysobacter firmicutimachus TaxID=1792846 RepID=A0AAU8MX97_9GAMM